MIPHDTDIERALKWLQNEAPNIQLLIKQKASWYDTYHERFWADWYTTAFNIDTASDFGIVVWCIILGLSAEPFGLEPNEYSWAYGRNRQNFVYSGPLDPLQNPELNAIGGNFFGGGAGAIGDIDEIRKLLKLRYVALISNGSVHFVNKMLRHIFNGGKPWDFAAGQYFYLMDCTGAGTSGDLQVNEMIATYEDGRSNVILRDFPRSNFVANESHFNIDVATVASGLPYSAPAKTYTARGSQQAYVTIETDAETGAMTFQVLVKADPKAQISIDITNTNSSRTNVLIDVFTKSVIKVTGSLIGFTIEDDLAGYLKIALCVSIVIAQPVIQINIARNQSIVSPDEGLKITLAAPMLTQGLGSAIYIDPESSGQGALTDYVVVPSSAEVTLGYLPSEISVIGEPTVKWKGAWKGGSVSEPTALTVRGSANQLQIPVPANSVASIDDIMSMEYRIGPNGVVSDQAAVLLAQTSNGIIPTFAGCKISVVKETP